MADTSSPLLQLLLMGDGLHDDTWGDLANTNFDSIENAIAGTEAIAVTSTAQALTQAQNANAVLALSGALTAATVLTVQPTSKLWVVYNGTSGAYSLTLTTGSGGTVAVPQGTYKIVYCDGVNVVDVGATASINLPADTVFANIGAGNAAVAYADFLTAIGLAPASTPSFAGMAVNGVAATVRAIVFQTAAAARWLLGTNADAESGANAGSDFTLDAYADDGATLIGHALAVIRSTLAATWAGSLNVVGALTQNGVQVGLQGLAALPPRLIYSSTTAVKLIPGGGQSYVQIAGAAYAIPAAGISASPTSTFLNGVAAQPLVAGTLYYAYAFNNSGTLALDFSATGHSTDTATGNVGVEIKTGNNSRSLVGMVYPVTGPLFAPNLVVSWFNRKSLSVTNHFTTNRSTTSGTLGEINAEVECDFLTWADEAAVVAVNGPVENSGGTGATITTAIGVDSTTASSEAYTQSTITGSGTPVEGMGMSFSTVLAEGFHYATLLGSTTASTATWPGSGSVGSRVTLNVTFWG
jgi:hypothetical protein